MNDALVPLLRVDRLLMHIAAFLHLLSRVLWSSVNSRQSLKVHFQVSQHDLACRCCNCHRSLWIACVFQYLNVQCEPWVVVVGSPWSFLQVQHRGFQTPGHQYQLALIHQFVYFTRHSIPPLIVFVGFCLRYYPCCLVRLTSFPVIS